ncbi:hypothetical protein B5181_12195 [Streptomyces sp. 4F]|nr:hypothetical protein B5181_12195 [Streptomyces sp. 4F]
MFVLSPAAGLWRLIVLRPLYLYAMATCRRIGDWGTRTAVEVRVARVEGRGLPPGAPCARAPGGAGRLPHAASAERWCHSAAS